MPRKRKGTSLEIPMTSFSKSTNTTYPKISRIRNCKIEKKICKVDHLEIGKCETLPISKIASNLCMYILFVSVCNNCSYNNCFSKDLMT